MTSTREPGRAHAVADRTDRETDYHPALEPQAGTGMAAGTVLIVVLVSLLVAGLLNSAWMVRTAEGMRPGLAKAMATAVAVPFDAVASGLGLDRPRRGVDALLGREPVVGVSEIEIETLAAPPAESDSASLASNTPVKPPIHIAPATVKPPTTAAPARILVLGDSLSTYTGQRLAEVLADRKLAKATVRFRNGTGLATPQVFNWPAWALQQIDEVQPDAVVVILGGNDNQDLQRKGAYFARGTPEWQSEYQRRVAVVMKAMIEHGADRVYWSGPPTARKAEDNELYRQLNLAARAAAKTVAGARFVDLAGPTSLKGEWLDVLAFGNEAFRARMGDGFHWSWKASQITSRLVADAMKRDYGALY